MLTETKLKNSVELTASFEVKTANTKIIQSQIAEHSNTYSSGYMYKLRTMASEQAPHSLILSTKNKDTSTPIGIVGNRNKTNYLLPLSSQFADPVLAINTIEWFIEHSNLPKVPLVLKRIPIAWTQTREAIETRFVKRSGCNFDDERTADMEVDLELFNDITLDNGPSRKLRKKLETFAPFSNCVRVLKNHEATKTVYSAPSILKYLCCGHTHKEVVYDLMVYALATSEQPKVMTWFFNFHETPLGFYIAEKLGKETVALYCGISSRFLNGCTEWMDIKVFRELTNLGFKKLLLGGSETEGVESYVKKLKLDISKQLTTPIGLEPLIIKN